MIGWKELRNVPQMLSLVEQQAENRVLIRYLHGMDVIEVTATDFFSHVRQYALFLQTQGLAGCHIGMIGANSYHWLVSFCAVLDVGGIAVLFSPDLNSDELAERALQVDLQGLIYEDSLFENGSLVNLSPEIAQIPMRAPADSPPVHSSQPVPVRSPDDPACILFTSGTTAKCKAVVLSHQAILAGACNNVIGLPFEAQLAILPFHHIAGLSTTLNALWLGAVVCIAENVKQLYRCLSKLKPDYVLTVPSLLEAIVKKLKSGGVHGSRLGWNLRIIACGGARFPNHVIDVIRSQDIHILQGYGATETGGLGFYWEMSPDCPYTIGKPCPGLEAKLIDGELFLKSTAVMLGYYGDPSATAQVLRDGWYATGDLGYVDAQGCYHLTGRKKNLIILSNGENVSPEEIEEKLSTCPQIREVLVLEKDQKICAVIYPGESAEDQDAGNLERIRRAVAAYNRSVPLYKQVQMAEFVCSPLPKTPAGKIIRYHHAGGS